VQAGSSVTYFIAASGKAVTDATGVVWSGHAINESMMTINLFSVVFVAYLAMVKLARNDIAGTPPGIVALVRARAPTDPISQFCE
jgi:hypothetical protein